MKRLAAALLFAGLALGGALLLRPDRASPGPATRLVVAPRDETAGFARATQPRAFCFPRDHGPHYAYQTEWWYYTGNLSGPRGERFGYQLTFFRRGLSPGPPPAGPGLATNQVYLAHFAITDVAERRHAFSERLARGAAGLAGASGEPYRVFLDDWSVEAVRQDASAVRLRAADGELGLDLTLQAQKPVVAQGRGGLSAKSDQPGNASYYLSETRLDTTGELRSAGRRALVSGSSWFDHEWSTSALGPDAVGWDWLSLQLDDGRDLMLFRIRRGDGGMERVSGGTLVARDGSTRHLGVEAFVLEPSGVWTSPLRGTRYPAAFHLEVPSLDLELRVEPLLADQEMRTSFVYWEGAVSARGRSGGTSVSGRGYLELTGYASPLRGLF